MSFIFEAYKALSNSCLKPYLKILIELRISQINNCLYCIKLHTDEAIKLGIDSNKINSLSNFEKKTDFLEEEKEALRYAESLTRLDSSVKKVYETKLFYLLVKKRLVI